ncbi:MotA/TolQ/ExbB proton channel family protein [Halopseudomonas aestusnigri]|uniref:Biopolymer transport protein ExbB n=1 Tax=Halopseudomonas aestusnigri TaxID=857252 RepID=A0AAQ1JRE9_9GAMM|nr:MotA/TolQ/ExbB proton channel family protein [Halopseudomonas aestusnigri]OWL84686.1 flagellar motor protein MotA [Halopseudomonas aestusnigri]SEG68041.1 biopolymer transport protein ExbB [Halopseudomonas aestusnigri]
MKWLAFLFVCLLAPLGQAQTLDKDALLQSIRDTRSAEQAAMQAREQQFLRERDQQQQRLAQARARLAQAQARADQLDAQFKAQGDHLAALREQLTQRSGNLGELFGVVRQGAGDTLGQWQDSQLNSRFPERRDELEALAQSSRIPSVEALEQFWYRLQQDMTASGEVARISASVVDRQGRSAATPVVLVGPFVALSEPGYLLYQSDSDSLQLAARQPGSSGLVADFLAPREVPADILIDPARGQVIAQLQRTPDLLTRVSQGGIVGYVIVTLGVLGVLLALARLIWLQRVQRGVDRQIDDLDALRRDNPLGRVLSVIGSKPRLEELDTLELKLDEAILRETPALERWQGLIKLLAAVAPLLGLLGTVTGMIVTFQAITQYGSGDPKLMADGISQALVTTVLGLLAAIPLLFLHTLVAARSKALIQLLEQQSAGLIALHLGGGESRD